MNYKHILTTLTFAFILALTACAGGSGGGSSSSGNNEPAPSVVRANTYNAQGNVTGYKLTTTNSAGNPTRETYYDNDGQPLSTIEYTYDGPRLTGRIRRNARGEIIARTRINYDGGTRRSNRYAPNGDLLSYILTTTNNAGQTTREDTYAPNGDLIEYTTYLYDGDGFRTEQRNYAGADRKLTTYTRYRYHPDGTLRSEHTYNAEGLLEDYTTYTYGRGDALDDPDDTDGDGIADANDNCPTLANPDQKNDVSPGNTRGDACDDTDNDGPYDASDNCPTTPNNDQEDTDRDGTGDACDERYTRPGDNITVNDIDSLELLLSVFDGKSLHARLTAHIEITPEALRAIPSYNTTEWTPRSHYSGVFDGNGYTIRFRGFNNQALFIIGTRRTSRPGDVRVTNLGVIGGVMASENYGNISNSYATGDNSGRGGRGGLVNFNNGIIRNSYALGNSASTGANLAGGLVGINNNDGRITNSYATGNATRGLIGSGDASHIHVINSYVVHSTTNTLGERRTIEELECPTTPGDRLCLPHTYIGWDGTVWDFGDRYELPILRGFAPCPRTAPNCRRYRAAGDIDNDGVANLIDNCLTTPNPHQYNNDSDLLGDACDDDDDNDRHLDTADNCPTIANNDQDNTDRLLEPDNGINGITILGDACDPDDDGDGIDDGADNCPYIRNFLQGNADNDALGDACDDDDDNDDRLDTADNCPRVWNKEQANLDNDNLGDACDPDLDGDGHNNTLPGTGISVINATDNCPTIANPDQTDTDLLFRIRLGLEPKNDGGDACDDDDDEDGRPDTNDNCRTIRNYDQANTDGDALGDACDPDRDGDGHNNTLSGTGISVINPIDNCPTVANPQQTNTDGDALGDACDPDLDGDGHNNTLSYIRVPGATDNCPTVANPDQTDTDLPFRSRLGLEPKEDGGDACDNDDDEDGIDDRADNCRTTRNHDQNNTDGDALGDACDPDDDNDSIPDGADNCPTIANAQYQDQTYATCQNIRSATDLIDHLTADTAGYYRLMANLTILADADWTSIPNFRGTFNGDNHTITFYATQPNPPLFQTINSTATVTNIGILNNTLADTNHGNISYAYATGNSTCSEPSCNNGGLVGLNTGLITNSYATGRSRGNDNSGGLVGYNTGIVRHSYATGYSTCTAFSCYSGGLVGYNTGHITDSYATGYSTCTAFSCYSGGLAGYNFYGTITNSHATGRSSSDGDSSGGLVGYNTGRIINSYATGDSSGLSHSGGLVGYNSYDANIIDSYATGNSSSDGSYSGSYSGGLVGYHYNGHIINAYATGNSSSYSSYSFSYSGGLVGSNTGTINHSYATGDSSSRSDSSYSSSYSGGLIGSNSGRIIDAYATGNSRSRSDGIINSNSDSGGLVGYNNGRITNAYAAGDSTCAGRGCTSDGLVGRNNDMITSSYRVQRSGTNTFGDHRTLAQLRCPTVFIRICLGSTTYSNWNTAIWNFGRSRELPTLHDMPPCLIDNLNCRHRITFIDDDGEGIPNKRDNCPTVANFLQVDQDRDSIGDVCDPDRDGDGYNNTLPGTNIPVINPTDNCPTVVNSQQTNTDGDDLGDACDPDLDDDGYNNTLPGIPVINPTDNCPTAVNPQQTNTDGDDLGDACDDDDDNDNVPDGADNCRIVSNPDQTNTDSDNLGDACDPDKDGDGDLNEADKCPTDAEPTCEGIATSQDLINHLHGTNGDNGYYRLTKSITINTGWTSITNFRGTLNGNNYTIRGLTTPLFHTINASATVANLGIIGSILANENYGNISYAYATGDSSCADLRCNNGGLVGQNHGIISHSYATGNSRCAGLLCRSGGLVGRNHNDGIITHSYAIGNSRCTTNDCSSGGLVGINRNIINASYAIGLSSCHVGNCFVGGLVGRNLGAVTASYATGDHHCSRCSNGGLIGRNDNTGRITMSYATGSSRSPYGGGLVRWSSGTIIDSYRVHSSGNSFIDAYGDHRTLAQLRCPTFPGQTCEGRATYGSWDNTTWNFGTENDLPTIRGLPPCPHNQTQCRHYDLRADADDDSIPDDNDTCPFIYNPVPSDCTDSDGDKIADAVDNCRTTSNPSQINSDGDDYGDACDAFPTNRNEHQDSDGDGIGNNGEHVTCRTIPNAHVPNAPYCQDIRSATDLRNHLTGGDTGYYRLTASITISASTTWTAVTNFRGTFNGAGHTITFRATHPPLFHTISSTATVTNIGIRGSILAYRNYGTITNSHATGRRSFGSINGGLVARNYNTGTITSSYATGSSFTSVSYSGGLVGYNTGRITSSYATGSSSSLHSGGLVGFNYGTITNSHATGSSRSSSRSSGSSSGGLVGFNYGTITNSHATGSSRSSGNIYSFSVSGGLVGYNIGTITTSHATGTSAGYQSGGLVGFNTNRIISSYATGASTCEGTGATIAGYNKRCTSGGLVGRNTGTIERTYALGKSTCDPSNTWQTRNSRCSSGGLVGANDGTIRYAYALGEVMGFYSGGLVGLQGYNLGGSSGSSIGNLADAYARFAGSRAACTVEHNGRKQCTVCRGVGCDVGGAVGRFHSGTIARVYSTRTPWCAGDGGCSATGFVGSVHPRTPSLSAQNSYRTWRTGTGNVRDLPRTENQLRCPTAPNRCTPATYTNWRSTIWNFGTSSNLPTLKNLPACPSSRPNCRH